MSKLLAVIALLLVIALGLAGAYWVVNTDSALQMDRNEEVERAENVD